MRRVLLGSRRSCSTVLGIETSCDDTSVCIVSSDRRVLARETYTNRAVQARIGGISPRLAARQHRDHLPSLISSCVSSSGVRLSSLSAVAVSTRPGLVIALKEGARQALHIARMGRVPLIGVHHMRAHSLVASMVHSDLRFPFISILISGGHALIVLVKSVDDFVIYGKSIGGSPGECLDKIGREMGISSDAEFRDMHCGRAVEMCAERWAWERAPSSSLQSLLPSSVPSSHSPPYTLPPVPLHGALYNFTALKSAFFTTLRKSWENETFDRDAFCWFAQYSLTAYLMKGLHAVLCHLATMGDLADVRDAVVGGGVAANRHIGECVRRVCDAHRVRARRIPPELCTDNAEMIAWTGLMMLESGRESEDIILPEKLPETIYVQRKSEVGVDKSHEVSKKPYTKFRIDLIS